jgi:hypothetical protein
MNIAKNFPEVRAIAYIFYRSTRYASYHAKKTAKK